MPNHFHDIVGFPNQANQFLVLRLQKLKQSPDGNVLERGITAAKEPAKIPVDSTIGLGPCLYEN